jgi:hypothetical protein
VLLRTTSIARKPRLMAHKALFPTVIILNSLLSREGGTHGNQNRRDR